MRITTFPFHGSLFSCSVSLISEARNTICREARMKIELCAFSGYKIYPGHGRTLVKVDGKTYKFLSGRTQKAHDLKRNPRKINWTVLYRYFFVPFGFYFKVGPWGECLVSVVIQFSLDAYFEIHIGNEELNRKICISLSKVD
jgi:ribosomal protein L24E